MCYLQSVELKGNNNYKITICHFCDNRTNKHIFDYVMNGDHSYQELLRVVTSQLFGCLVVRLSCCLVVLLFGSLVVW